MLLVGTSNVSSDLVVTLTRILFPIVVLMGLFGVVTGILNAQRIFGVPAFAPVAWNLVIIAVLLVSAAAARSSTGRRCTRGACWWPPSCSS